MAYKDFNLNDEAASLIDDLLETSEVAEVRSSEIGGAEVIDCGVLVPGSLRAGCTMAEACMGGLGLVTFSTGRCLDRPCAKVTVEVDQPAIACLISQYAGWKISHGDYFAMGSGPMRAIRGSEPLYDRLRYAEDYDIVAGVLESSELPSPKIIAAMADEIGVAPQDLLLLVAPSASLAGAVQIVSRSVETCMHKLFELGFDCTRVKSAIGTAFLPPVPKDDLTAIGRTNDSILYGAEVFLWLYGKDEDIETYGPQTPSSASKDYGENFASIFKRYDGDFYKIDPLLFSPAEVTFNNLATGFCQTYGKLNLEAVRRSFFGE